MLTDVGLVEVKVPRDVAGTFEPQIVKKRQRSLTGVDEMALAFSGISPHFQPRRHLITVRAYRHEMTERFTVWRHVTGCTARPWRRRLTPPGTPQHASTPHPAP